MQRRERGRIIDGADVFENAREGAVACNLENAGAEACAGCTQLSRRLVPDALMKRRVLPADAAPTRVAIAQICLGHRQAVQGAKRQRMREQMLHFTSVAAALGSTTTSGVDAAGLEPRIIGHSR